MLKGVFKIDDCIIIDPTISPPMLGRNLSIQKTVGEVLISGIGAPESPSPGVLDGAAVKIFTSEEPINPLTGVVEWNMQNSLVFVLKYITENHKIRDL